MKLRNSDEMNKQLLVTCGSIYFCWLQVMATAIEPGESDARFALVPTGLTAEAVFAWEDIDSVLELDLNRNGILEETELGAASHFLSEYGETLYHFDREGETLEVSSVTSSWNAQEMQIAFHYSIETDAILHDLDSLTIDFVGMGDFPAGHRQRIEVTDGQGRVLARWFAGEPGARPLHSLGPGLTSPVVQELPSPGLAMMPRPARSRSLDIALVLFAAGFLLIAMVWSVWFIRRAEVT